MAEAAAGMRPEVLMAVGSRGFLFATAVAQRLGLPVVCAQPAGKLPGPVHREGYSMVYDRAKAMELPSDLGHLVAGKNAVVVDDAVATGGSLLAAKRLLEGAGMRCTGCLVPFEDGRHGKLEEYLEELAPLTVTWFDLL
ncbi:phosphoribosyltransferase-like protein [Hyaloraphidium curvatum]|nr:phosphoribosyltransferase-like protein [Hyaloraphidium curvatum]